MKMQHWIAVVVTRGGERRQEVFEHVVGERVARLGLIERDRGDPRRRDLVGDVVVGHGAQAYVAGRPLAERASGK